MTDQSFTSRLASTLLVGASFAALLTGLAWYGFIIHANDKNTATLRAIESEVIGVVESNHLMIEDSQRMLSEIQASMEDRTKRLDEIKGLLEKKP